MAYRLNRPPPFDNPALTPNAPAPTPHGHGRTRPNPRIGDVDMFRNSHVQIQTDSSSDDDIHVSKPKPVSRPPQHSRSKSHPFPSLFASKKKKETGYADDSTDDNSPARNQSSSRPTMTPRTFPRGPTDFTNGYCMTCGSLVRWPKELDVFRCTICLTINDLKPYTPVREEGKGAQNLRPISLEHTRYLVRESLQHTLRSFMALNGRDITPGQWPSRSSSRVPEDYFSQGRSRFGHGRTPSATAALCTPPPYVQNPVFDEFSNMSLEPNPLMRNENAPRSYSTSYPDARSSTFPMSTPQQREQDWSDPKKIFKAVEDYLIMSFTSPSCINTSFLTHPHNFHSRPPPTEIKRKPLPVPVPESRKGPVYGETPVSELDPKLLLVGDFAENGGWWTGGQQETHSSRSHSRRKDEPNLLVNSRSPQIDWGEVMEWYHLLVNSAESWTELYQEIVGKDPNRALSEFELRRFEASILEAQEHIQRVLLKCTENLLKRPGRVLKEPQHVRFLLLILANPLLDGSHRGYLGLYQQFNKGKGIAAGHAETQGRSAAGRHSGIIKRILGLLSNSSEQCHHHLVCWLSRLPENLFLRIKDLISSFITYRLTRQNEKKPERKVDVTAGLIPQMPNSRAGNTPASLHAALEASNNSKKKKQPAEPKILPYINDWQIKAGARVMALVFTANNLTHVRRNEVSVGHGHGHLLATSDFYNTLLDCLDFKTDFEMWESRRGKFAFCQYPFFLSIWAKIQILEFDAKRQMVGKAREAFFDSILTHKTYTQYLFLSVRRECLVEDSLKQVSEVVGSGSEDIKKGLRIEFQGEEGVDAGGLRKEWFLLLVREVFNPDHGLFVFDEDSQYCYFNPQTFETSDQYFLIGVVLGLAIYNSTILDIAFPPFAFRKLLAAAPPPAAGSSSHPRTTMTYTLDDLAEYQPRLAKGLRQLLEYEDDVQSTFCLDFVIDVERYGSRVRVPLCPGGDAKMVTNANRREYVDLYVRYLLDTSVTRQFEPFKRGFFTMCAGNALSLFRPEEIELLVRGSDESLDIVSLRAVASYTNWCRNNKSSKEKEEPENEPTIDWFWQTFETASAQDQRRLLSFITGSDRIPAMGAASLTIKINCLGDDIGRYPTARTCFNTLNLYRYPSEERLESYLWRAVNESEGFGLR